MNICLKSQHHCRIIRRRVRVGKTSAKGPSIPYLRVADQSCRLRQSRTLIPDQRRGCNVMMRRKCTNLNNPIEIADLKRQLNG